MALFSRRRYLSRLRFVCVRRPKCKHMMQQQMFDRFEWEIFDGDEVISVDQLVDKANRLEKHVQALLQEVDQRELLDRLP